MANVSAPIKQSKITEIRDGQTVRARLPFYLFSVIVILDMT
jgi:hypothetical protein